MGWEEVVVDLAAEILADPTPNRYAYSNFKFPPSVTGNNLSAIFLCPVVLTKQ